MPDYNEIRFGYLRALSKDDKLAMIQDLEEDVKALEAIIDDSRTIGEHKSELRSDIAYETAKIEYLRGILEEKTL